MSLYFRTYKGGKTDLDCLKSDLFRQSEQVVDFEITILSKKKILHSLQEI